jgi:DNA replication and repair protein RecF
VKSGRKGRMKSLNPTTFADLNPLQLQLNSLKLTYFKNYASLSLQLSPRFNCFTGLNGTGKTNVLDAIYLLCLTKSHRNLPDKSLVQHGADLFRVEGVFEHLNEYFKTVVKLPPGQRKILEVNGQETGRLADHIGRFPVVMIAPDDVALLQEGSEERRRLIDVTLSQTHTHYLTQLLLYNALLKQRNALLKAFAEHRRFDATLLEAIDVQLAAPAAAVHQYRMTFCTEIQPIFADLYARIAGGREVATLDFESDWPENDDFSAQLTAQLERDRALERTTRGPHRDDLLCRIEGHPVKKFASQGQMKSYLLALRLAQYEWLRQQRGVSPLLLLDDIFDKLDQQRVRQLLTLLVEGAFGQIFITDTQRERLAQIFKDIKVEYLFFETSEINKSL